MSSLSSSGETPSRQVDIAANIKRMESELKKHGEDSRKQEFRQYFDFIEKMIVQKKSNAAIIKALKGVGFVIAPATFKAWLEEIRQERAKESPIARSMNST